MNRRRWGVALVLIAAIAIVAHLAFWYRDRERAGGLIADSWAWLNDSGHDYRVVLPYPHQNLPVWSEELGLEIGPESPFPFDRLRGFGWFALPPAREMLVAWGTSSSSSELERWAVRARMYPAPALLMRVAGRLAGNVWLSGGRLTNGSSPVVVEWEGSVWNVHGVNRARGQKGGVAEVDGARPLAGRAPDDAVLLAWASSSSLPVVGRGPVAVRRVGGQLWLDEMNSEIGPVRSARPAARRPPPVLAEARSLLETSEACVVALEVASLASLAQLIAILGPLPDHRQAAAEGTVRVPSALVLTGSEVREPWPLPAVSLSESLGMVSIEEQIGEWRLRATDARAARMAPALVAVLEMLGDGALPRQAALWLEPRQVNVLVQDILQVLAASPLLSESEREPWLELRSWTKPFNALGFAGVWLDAGRGQLVLER